MEIKKYFYIVLILTSYACNSVDKKESEKAAITVPEDTTDKTVEIADSLIPADFTEVDSSETFFDVSNWILEDFIVHAPKGYHEELKNSISYYLEMFSNANHPIIATYLGSDIGDYFHLSFKDDFGNEYDFGFGNNEFGLVQLYDEETLEDNKQYINKKFLIYWSWEVSTYPCCSGEYDAVTTYMPSIKKLELLK